MKSNTLFINKNSISTSNAQLLVKICILILNAQAISLYADVSINATSTESQEMSKLEAKATNNAIKPTTQDIKAKTDATKKKAETQKHDTKILPITTTLFVNGRVNPILLVITDDKNNQFKVHIKAGSHYSCGHKSQALKKAVVYEIQTQSTTLSHTDLNTYAGFVFNTDQKLEKYHFINIHQKQHALKQARKLKNETLFNDIADQIIYHP